MQMTCKQNTSIPNQRSNNMVSVGPGTASQVPVLTARGSQVPDLTEHRSQVPDLTEHISLVPDLTARGSQVPDLTARGSQVPDLTEQRSQVPDLTAQGPQVPDLTARGPGTSPLTLWQNDSHTQVPINKFLEILLQTLHSKQLENKQLKEEYTQLEQKIRMAGDKIPELVATEPATQVISTGNKTKEPISRTKSAPESSVYQGHSDVRKTSHPEIFLFPETRDIRKNTLPLNSNANRKNIMKDQATSMSVDDDVKTGDSGVHSDKGSGEYHSLKDSLQEPPGVSVLCFNNVINELIKTKTYLHNLEIKQRIHTDDSSENQMDKMRNEIQQLRLRNQHLERERARREQDTTDSESQSAPRREDSFEVSTESEAELIESSQESSPPSTQMYDEVGVQRLREEVEELTKQNEVITREKCEIQRELVDLNDDYDKLKGNVKILSTCLQEEKTRSRCSGDKLRIKNQESQKLSSQLGSLRQQYEELRQEKHALEKTRSLEDTPSLRFTSPHSRSFSSEFNRSGSNYSGELSRCGSNTSNYVPQFSSRSDSYNIRPEHWPPRLPFVAQNDLSSVERKPSNVPQFSGSSPAPFECPRCWQKFQVENSFLLHLSKCIE